MSLYTVKALSSPRGLFDSGHSSGGLIRQEGIIHKIKWQEYDGFSVLLPHIMQILHVILWVKYDLHAKYNQN